MNIDETLQCLHWSHGFAQGASEADPFLQNPVFQEWLKRCEATLRLNGIDPFRPFDKVEVLTDKLLAKYLEFLDTLDGNDLSRIGSGYDDIAYDSGCFALVPKGQGNVFDSDGMADDTDYETNPELTRTYLKDRADGDLERVRHAD